jgi:CDP-glycerol glycerophosphotransferase (TagB/SpsB family)
MEDNMRKKLLIVITNGFAATNVIHSGLMQRMDQVYEVHVLSDLMGENEIRQINLHFGMHVKLFRAEIPIETGILKMLRRLEKAIFFRHFNIVTQAIRERREALWMRYSRGVILSSLKFLGITRPLLIFLRKVIISRSVRSGTFASIRHQQFSGIISTSPLDIRENIIVNSLKHRIPSLAMVISWDNLTTKGIINADHDYVLLWNNYMAAEYKAFYEPFSKVKSKICVTGVPRFDLHFGQNPGEVTEIEFREKFDFGGAKIILFATSAAKHFPEQADIVRHLVEYAGIRKNVKILVRCHAGDDLGNYRQFEHENCLSIPSLPALSGAGSTLVPGLRSLLDLSEMLKYSDVCINVASTMRLDAAACNKPIISIAYDGDKSKPYYNSVRRFYDYAHQLELNKLAIDRTVYSKRELFETLDEILFCPTKKAPNGAETISSFTHFTKPVSVQSILNTIGEWLN